LLKRGVTPHRALLLVALAILAGCRGPSPRDGFDRATIQQERVARIGGSLLKDVGIEWGVSARDGLGAWSWPCGRVHVSRALVDLLDDEELAAALAHELGHLLDRGHLPNVPRALRGVPGGNDLELRADRIGCDLLARRGVPLDAMPRMLAKVAAGLGGDPDLARRAAAAGAVCASGRVASSAR
jgi:Zn-dependent protease with chaperone function